MSRKRRLRLSVHRKNECRKKRANRELHLLPEKPATLKLSVPKSIYMNANVGTITQLKKRVKLATPKYTMLPKGM